VTDTAVTGVIPPGGGPAAAPGVEVVAGVEVHDLVERSEQVIQALRQQLEAALREAEEAERQLASHPGAARLGGSATRGQADPTEQIAVVAPKGAGVEAGPRTTVVSRPRATTAVATDPIGGEASGYRHSASAPVTGWARAFTSHLVLKIGALLTVVAVLLLVFVS